MAQGDSPIACERPDFVHITEHLVYPRRVSQELRVVENVMQPAPGDRCLLAIREAYSITQVVIPIRLSALDIVSRDFTRLDLLLKLFDWVTGSTHHGGHRRMALGVSQRLRPGEAKHAIARFPAWLYSLPSILISRHGDGRLQIAAYCLRMGRVRRYDVDAGGYRPD